MRFDDLIIQELDARECQDLTELRLPVVLKNKILMSPGMWNGYYYDAEAIREAFENTDWNSKEVRSLFMDHKDTETSDWVGFVSNPKFDGKNIKADLEIIDENMARKLLFGAKFGISPRLVGQEDNKVMKHFTFQNFSIVVNPAVKTAFINNALNEEGLKMEEANELEEQISLEERMERLETALAEISEILKKKKKEPEEEELKKKKKPEEEELKKKKKPEEEEMKKKKKYPYPYPYDKLFDILELDDFTLEDEGSEILEEFVELKKKGSKVARIAKKAKEIRKKGESWKAAIKRAAKMLEEEEKPEEESKEPEEKTEEASEKEEKEGVVQKMHELTPGLALPVEGSEISEANLTEEEQALRMDEVIFKILKEGGI